MPLAVVQSYDCKFVVTVCDRKDFVSPARSAETGTDRPGDGGGTTAIVRDWPVAVHVDVSVNGFDSYPVETGALYRCLASSLCIRIGFGP